MKIIISERQLEKVLGHPDIIKEQTDAAAKPTTAPVAPPINEASALNTLNKAIDDLIEGEKLKKEILNTCDVLVTGTATEVKISLGAKGSEVVYNMPYNKLERQFQLAIGPGSSIGFGTLPMTGIAEAIKKLPAYLALVDKHPEITAQIDKGQLSASIGAGDSVGKFKFSVGQYNKKRFHIKWGTPHQLGEFLLVDNNLLRYKISDTTAGFLQTDALEVNMSFTPITLSQGTVAGPEPIVMPELVNLFNFDNVSFINPASAKQQLDNFVGLVQRNIIDAGPNAIKNFLAQNPTIEGFSSIDGDPNEQMKGAYGPCSNNTTRKDYDMCLSTERAKVIADYLNKALPKLGGNAFKFKGMGETKQFGVKPEDNRRIRLSQMTSYAQAAPVAPVVPTVQA